MKGPHLLTAILAVWASAASALIPTPTGLTLSIPRVRSTNYMPNGLAAKRRVFKKYGWSARRGLGKQDDTFMAMVKASIGVGKATAKQSGKVPAIPTDYHEEYISPVTIGGQSLNMDFDTGSSDMWVFSTYLTKRTIGQHDAFNPNLSTTFQPLEGYTWGIQYGDGSGAAGVVGTDVVNIGGATVTSQAIELATAISEQFVEDVYSDGLVGLGFSNGNNVLPERQKTFFGNVRASLKASVFVADLREDGSGFYEFGVVDSTKYSGTLTRIPVNHNSGYWQFKSPRFAVNGTKISNIGGSPAIADTGTSLLIVDDNVAEAYYAQVPNSAYSPYLGGFIIQCNAELPSFGVSLGGLYMATIPGRLLNYSDIMGGWCYGAIQGNGGYPLQIYGDLLFRSQFVVFENSATFVGLAVAPKSG